MPSTTNFVPVASSQLHSLTATPVSRARPCHRPPSSGSHSHAAATVRTMSNNLASFAPYVSLVHIRWPLLTRNKTPPPDHPEYTPTPAPIRPWFPAHVSSSHEINTSYQSGGIPTFANSASGGGGNTSDTQQNQWETRYGLRIDILAALAYLLGPISGRPSPRDSCTYPDIPLALTLLIIETQNDYVRFHGMLTRHWFPAR